MINVNFVLVYNKGQIKAMDEIELQKVMKLKCFEFYFRLWKIAKIDLFKYLKEDLQK